MGETDGQEGKEPSEGVQGAAVDRHRQNPLQLFGEINAAVGAQGALGAQGERADSAKMAERRWALLDETTRLAAVFAPAGESYDKVCGLNSELRALPQWREEMRGDAEWQRTTFSDE